MRLFDCALSRSGATLRGLIEKQPDSSAYEIAEVYALRNEAKKTFAWLARPSATASRISGRCNRRDGGWDAQDVRATELLRVDILRNSRTVSRRPNTVREKQTMP